jgi:hypothetical protein
MVWTIYIEQRLWTLFRNHAYDIFVRDDVTKANSLRVVSRAGSPDQGVPERLLESTMNLIAHILN